MNIRSVLDKMIAARGSDLHLKAGTPPVVRVDGVLYTLDEPPPSAQQLREVCDQLLNEEQRAYFSSQTPQKRGRSVLSLKPFTVLRIPRRPKRSP